MRTIFVLSLLFASPAFGVVDANKAYQQSVMAIQKQITEYISNAVYKGHFNVDILFNFGVGEDLLLKEAKALRGQGYTVVFHPETESSFPTLSVSWKAAE